MAGPDIITMGCRLNIAESEAIRQMAAGQDDLIVVNSCAVTAEAVRQTRQAIRRARRERPDAILLDIGLPAGDGFMVLDRLRSMEEVADTPVIVVSAKDPGVIKDQLFKAGADGFFQKPINNEQLLRVLACTV